MHFTNMHVEMTVLYYRGKRGRLSSTDMKMTISYWYRFIAFWRTPQGRG